MSYIQQQKSRVQHHMSVNHHHKSAIQNPKILYIRTQLMKKKRKNRHQDTLFIIWMLSAAILFVLFLFYWISVNKLVILILASILVFQLLKRFGKQYLSLFYLAGIVINMIYGFMKLL